MDTYTPEEFIERMKSRGLSTKKEARRYVTHHKKQAYTEDDFIEAYHAIEYEGIGRKVIRKQGDGRAVYMQKQRGVMCFAGVEE